MYKEKIKRVFILMLSICVFLTQGVNVSFAGQLSEKQEENYLRGYRELEPIDSSFAGTTSKRTILSESGLPASYCASADFKQEVEQSDDHVTSVKNQEHGTCWAHSAISLAESSFIINEGVSPDSIDFNEYHLVHYGFGQAADSLNLFGGDYNSYAGDSNVLENGGNNSVSLCMFASWQGASDASESEFGANHISNGERPETTLGYEDAAHMENGYVLTMPDMESNNYQADMEVIKNMIMKYGSVSISYYSEHSPTYFLACHQYYNEEHDTDHAVTVVGWDDTVKASSFAIAPPGNGAWIVKNSWGSDWGANGYFYLSYYDKTIYENAFVFDFVAGDNYDNNYQYDGAGCISNSVGGDYGHYTGANAFVADSDETLEAVGFYTNRINTNYEIRIYRGLEADANPNAGTLVHTQSGTEKYVGFHTVKLSEIIPVTQGERYAVVIKYYGDEDEYYTLPADVTDSYGWIEFISLAKAGESYRGKDIDSLKDLNPNNTTGHYRGKNLRIKAFTNEAESMETTLVSEVIIKPTSCEIEKGATTKLAVSVLPANATNADVEWSSNNEAVATVGSDGTIYGVAGGTATITATAKDGSGKKASCSVVVKEVFAQGLKLAVDGEEVSYYRISSVGSTERFEAIFTPSDTTNKNVKWTSSNTSVLTVDENGTVRGVGRGHAILTATTTDGTNLSASCFVAVENVFVNLMFMQKNGTTVERLELTGIGQQIDLDVAIDPVEAEMFDVTWESDQESVVTVDQNGVITTTGFGDAFITASVSLDMVYDVSCYVNVSEEVINVESVQITLNGVSVESKEMMGLDENLDLDATVLPSNASNKNVQWESSDYSVASADKNGIVRVYSYGTAIITARADNNVTDRITITVKPKKYTIRFNGNGATKGSMASMECVFDTTYTLPANQFVRTGYQFLGWNTQADGGGRAFTDKDSVWRLCDTHGGSVTLYAQWFGSDSIPVPAKPYKISNLSTGVCVYWKKTDNAKKYGVWRSENGKNGTYKRLATTSSLNYTDKTAKSGKTYYYKVTVYDSTQKMHGAKSTAVGIYFLSAPKVSKKENLSTGLKLQWGKVTGATGYVIYRKTHTGITWKKVATITSGSKLTYTDKSLKSKNGTTYCYRIKATKGSTTSGYKSNSCITRLTKKSLSGAKKLSKTSLKCSWITSSKVTGYEVRLMVGSKVYKTYKITSYKTSSKTIKGLTKGKKYKIQIRSYKKVSGVGTSYSAWSDAKYVTLK